MSFGEIRKMKRILLFMSNYEDHCSSGGNIARRTVQFLNDSGYFVIVFTTGTFNVLKKKDSIIVSIPLGIEKRNALLLTRMGIIEDYLDKWVNTVLRFIIEDSVGIKITSNDVCLCTTVGELGTLKIGQLLKEKLGTRYIIHFHDPIKHAYVNGEKYGMYPLPYASREKYEKKYIEAADEIITCSKTFNKYLQNKYPDICNKIYNLYFGWMVDANPKIYCKTKSDCLRITYGGIFGWVQGPEILAMAVEGMSDIQITYVGNWSNYKRIAKRNQNNVILRNRMPHEEYMRFLMEDTDIGFLSLSRNYFSACVPAKLYEYINTGIPILAAVPDSDTTHIINDNGYGISTDYSVDKLKSILRNINYCQLNEYTNNILRDRDKWDFNNTMKGLVNIIEGKNRL